MAPGRRLSPVPEKEGDGYMILSGQTIRARGLITPFFERTEEQGMTFGVGPAGYDVRVEFDPEGSIAGIHFLPGAFQLASTIERFSMPDDVLGTVHDKSSWARLGLAVQNTVIEPGWCGYLTLELTNHSEKTLVLKRGMPIAQVVFQQLDAPSSAPYSGKYQSQGRGPQTVR